MKRLETPQRVGYDHAEERLTRVTILKGLDRGLEWVGENTIACKLPSEGCRSGSKMLRANLEWMGAGPQVWTARKISWKQMDIKSNNCSTPSNRSRCLYLPGVYG